MVYSTSAPISWAATVIPSRGDTVYVDKRRAEPPPEVIAYFAFGPITAIVLALSEVRGSNLLSFFKRTIASAAAVRNVFRSSGVSMDFSGPSNGIPDL